MCSLGSERDIMQYLHPSILMRAKSRKCFAQILRSGSVETQTSSAFAEIQVRASEPARDRSCPFSILAGIPKDISSYNSFGILLLASSIEFICSSPAESRKRPSAETSDPGLLYVTFWLVVSRHRSTQYCEKQWLFRVCILYTLKHKVWK